MEDLPKTLLDTVVITRRFGYEYNWIDALCIVQDREEDIYRELETMGEVYRNSVCTVAALGAENSDDGCFNQRNPLALEECQVRQGSQYLQFLPYNEPQGPETHAPHPPLHTRAWVVQERALSTRTLFYGSEMMCIQAKATEHNPEMENLWDAGAMKHIGESTSVFLPKVTQRCFPASL